MPFGRVPEIEAGELARKLAAGEVQVLDVRSPGEWRSGHIRGAVNHPVQTLSGRLDALALSNETPVVAICRSARRSIPAVRLLRRAGFRDAVQLAGGMNAWLAAGLPTVTPGD